MQGPRFQKRVEDFTCEFCGKEVKGGGYTNHCSQCLWSKHVDVHPGDRAEACLGMMEPIAVEGASPAYVIVHSCTRCGIKRRNKVEAADNMSTVIAIAQK